MGLDAWVYCDCVEKELVPLPAGVTFQVEEDGYPTLFRNGKDIEDADWNEFRCQHPSRTLLHHRLGNISTIALIRSEMAREPEIFPLLLQKVVYSGSHSGDLLPFNLIPGLQEELAKLKSLRCLGNNHYPASECDAFIQVFRQRMVDWPRLRSK